MYILDVDEIYGECTGSKDLNNNQLTYQNMAIGIECIGHICKAGNKFHKPKFCFWSGLCPNTYQEHTEHDTTSDLTAGILIM